MIRRRWRATCDDGRGCATFGGPGQTLSLPTRAELREWMARRGWVVRRGGVVSCPACVLIQQAEGELLRGGELHG